MLGVYLARWMLIHTVTIPATFFAGFVAGQASTGMAGMVKGMEGMAKMMMPMATASGTDEQAGGASNQTSGQAGSQQEDGP